MSKLLKQLLMLPREVRIRLMTAFALMAVIPLLAGVYVVTVHVAEANQQLPWLKAMLLTCMILACTGFIIMRRSLWGVVDIARTTEELLSECKKEGMRAPYAREILRLERFVLYMEDQVRAARRLLEAYRKSGKELRQFRLPPLIPSRLVRTRALEEARQAEQSGRAIGIISWRNNMVTPEETADETYVPTWLQQILRNSTVVPDTIGQLRPGHWIGWSHDKDSVQMQECLASMRETASANITSEVTVTAYSHPSDPVNLVAVLGDGATGESA